MEIRAIMLRKYYTQSAACGSDCKDSPRRSDMKNGPERKLRPDQMAAWRGNRSDVAGSRRLPFHDAPT